MLLSHNFNLQNKELPALNREEFAQVFVDGFQEHLDISCRFIENPHWVVEIIFPLEEFFPRQIGHMCGDILVNQRKSVHPDSNIIIDTLILGGKKTSPATGASPTSLQPGEWGVDVVETAQAETFLAAINWETMISSKPSDGIFKIELLKA